MKYDEVLQHYVGEFGRYQKTRYFLVCVPALFVSLHVLSWTFTGGTLDHRCRLIDEAENTTYYEYFEAAGLNISGKDEKNEKRRKEWFCARPNASVEQMGPDYFDVPDPEKDWCRDGYVYDHSQLTHSAINKWNIVCSRSWLRAFIQSMYYIGQAAGSLTFGWIGDRIGRKPAFMLAILLQCTSGLLMAFVPWVWAFAILRLIVGFGHPGVFVVSVVIGMELVGPSKRWIGGVATGIFFGIGQVVLGGLAYMIRDYVHLQLAISIPYFLFLMYWWIVPESARWLLSQGRVEEADKVLRAAAKANGRHLPEDWHEQLDDASPKSGGDQRTYGYADLFRTPNIRKRALSAFFLWPVVSMVYYGLGMNPSFLGGEKYLTFALAGIAEIPGVMLGGLLVNRLGRKIMALAGFTISGTMLMLTLAIPPDQKQLMSGFVIVAKMFITMEYAVIYIYTPELFPTPIRSFAMGMCSMMARIGAVAASYLIMWLADINKTAVVMIFGIFALLAAVVVLIQPETAGTPFLQTIEAAEAFGKNHSMLSFKPPEVDDSKTMTSDDTALTPLRSEEGAVEA